MESSVEAGEAFARAYAQYIAWKSGDATLRRSLDERMAGDQPPRIRLSQWTTVEFLTIAAAMDKLFEKAGWLTIRSKAPTTTASTKTSRYSFSATAGEWLGSARANGAKSTREEPCCRINSWTSPSSRTTSWAVKEAHRPSWGRIIAAAAVKDVPAWHEHVQAFHVATYGDNRLPVQEVRGIARSAAGYSLRQYSERTFGEIQRRRIRRRWDRPEARQGTLQYRRPWEAAGISRATWYRRRSETETDTITG